MSVQKKDRERDLKIKFYLDDDTDSDILIQVLKAEGFSVISPRYFNMCGKDDEEHLIFSTSQKAVLLTKNCEHFKKINKIWKTKALKHSGIIVLYQYNNPKRDMTPIKIVRSIKNVMNAGILFENNYIILNLWNY